MNDSSIRQNILDELEFEPSIDANDIGVAVEDGIVTLSGHVPNYSQKQAAERVVARVKGVRGIAEEIEVRYPGGSGVADDEIAKRVLNTLKWGTLVPDERVQVTVQKGWVTLTGKLDWNYQKVGVANAIRDLKGVTGVTNKIELKPQVTSVDVRKRIQEALKRSAEIEAQDIKIDVAADKVTLKGHVKTWNERWLVEDTAWATPGVTHVSDQLTVG
ncbi:BON domain-containing protein [Devosia sp. A16]|uniref:BON domain-containing protein n=1 Tax=Devosia sp. A16 TaxID=1736675 RepID=UPI0006D7F07A|nr:BON domain-containing protein [Devosia sp. A16]